MVNKKLFVLSIVFSLPTLLFLGVPEISPQSSLSDPDLKADIESCFSELERGDFLRFSEKICLPYPASTLSLFSREIDITPGKFRLLDVMFEDTYQEQMVFKLTILIDTFEQFLFVRVNPDSDCRIEISDNELFRLLGHDFEICFLIGNALLPDDYYLSTGILFDPFRAEKWVRMIENNHTNIHYMGLVAKFELYIEKTRNMDWSKKSVRKYSLLFQQLIDAGELDYLIWKSRAQPYFDPLTSKYLKQGANLGNLPSVLALGELYLDLELYCKMSSLHECNNYLDSALFQFKYLFSHSVSQPIKGLASSKIYNIYKRKFLSDTSDHSLLDSIYTWLDHGIDNRDTGCRVEKVVMQLKDKSVSTEDHEEVELILEQIVSDDPKQGAFLVGLLYLDGKLLPRDSTKSRRLLQLAVDNGVGVARRYIH